MTRRRSPARATHTARIRRLLALAGLALLACLVARPLLAPQPAAAADEQPVVDIVEAAGVIDDPISGYLTEAVATAEREGAEVLVIRLDTPGALGVSVDEVVSRISASEVPVAVWVGPAGTRATGAGVELALAADVLGVSPGAVVGAARPRLTGPPDGHQSAGGLVELADSPAQAEFARAAADGRAVAVTGPAGEALGELPRGLEPGQVRPVSTSEVVEAGVADVTAASLPQLLRALDGVALDGGERLEVNAQTANVRFDNLGLVRRIAHTIAGPTLSYLLLMAGALALAFEAFQPGFGVAGFSGVALAALGLYGVVVLPVSWLAFAGLLAGLGLLAADTSIGGLGTPTAAGAAGVTAGSFGLFTGSAALRPSAWLLATVSVATVAFFVVVLTVVLRSQGSQSSSAAGDLVGKTGIVRSVLNPEGHVFVNGGLWRARAPEDAGKVKTGTRVRVTGNEDVTLTVELEGSDESTPVG
jgi:membrane-bound serine protease (ClpP class)